VLSRGLSTPGSIGGMPLGIVLWWEKAARLTVVSGYGEEECELPGWPTNGQNGTVSDDHQCLQKRGIRRLRGFYFFHISCAQSGSQPGGDMRNASSAEDLWSPSIFSTSHA